MVLGTVYYDLSMSNLQAVQNRLGAFLLSCVFLCFTSVSALPVRRAWEGPVCWAGVKTSRSPVLCLTHSQPHNINDNKQLFWLEKNLYLHEQSNRFYSASAYFVCKVRLVVRLPLVTCLPELMCAVPHTQSWPHAPTFTPPSPQPQLPPTTQ